MKYVLTNILLHSLVRVLTRVEWSHPGTNDYSTRRGRPPTWAHVIPQTFFYYASDVVAYKVYNRSTQCRIQSV